MNKNKIISAVIIVIVLLIVLLFFINKYVASKKTVTNQSLQPPVGAVALPDSGTKKQVINDSKNLEEINSAFKKTLSQPIVPEATPFGFQPIEFKDKSNQTISLGDFANATGIKINVGIKDLLRENDYFVFRCLESTNNIRYGIVFHVKLLDSNKNLPSDEAKWMKEWEKTIFKDTYKIIFPDINFNGAELNQELNFKDGKYRFADVLLPSGSKGSINYSIVGDYVIIAGSKECLDKVSDYVEPIEPRL
jgi:hypothetical protein